MSREDLRLGIDALIKNTAECIRVLFEEIERLSRILKEAGIDPGAPPGSDLDRCPKCGDPADNGHDQEYPPNPYLCTRCSK